MEPKLSSSSTSSSSKAPAAETGKGCGKFLGKVPATPVTPAEGEGSLLLPATVPAGPPPPTPGIGVPAGPPAATPVLGRRIVTLPRPPVRPEDEDERQGTQRNHDAVDVPPQDDTDPINSYPWQWDILSLGRAECVLEDGKGENTILLEKRAADEIANQQHFQFGNVGTDSQIKALVNAGNPTKVVGFCVRAGYQYWSGGDRGEAFADVLIEQRYNAAGKWVVSNLMRKGNKGKCKGKGITGPPTPERSPYDRPGKGRGPDGGTGGAPPMVPTVGT